MAEQPFFKWFAHGNRGLAHSTRPGVTSPRFFRCEAQRSYSSPYSRVAAIQMAKSRGDRDYCWWASRRGKGSHLQRIEVRILAVTRENSAMCSFFYDSAPFHHDDPAIATGTIRASGSERVPGCCDVSLANEGRLTSSNQLMARVPAFSRVRYERQERLDFDYPRNL